VSPITGSTVTLPGPLQVCDNKWHSVVITSTGTVLSGYIDGVKVGEASSTTQFPTNGNILRIGSVSDYITSNQFSSFEGKLHDIFIYSSALSASDVALLYHPPLPTYQNALNPVASLSSLSYSYSCIGGYSGSNHNMDSKCFRFYMELYWWTSHLYILFSWYVCTAFFDFM
jgi:hypothetical protein